MVRARVYSGALCVCEMCDVRTRVACAVRAVYKSITVSALTFVGNFDLCPFKVSAQCVGGGALLAIIELKGIEKKE